MTISRRARVFRRNIGRFELDGDAPLDERRAAMERIDRLPRPRKVDYVDTTVGGVPAIVATPTREAPDRHILYLHGGGYVVGSPRSHIAMAARLAKRASATATVIDYRLAPEHPYPAAVDDCVAAYWRARRAGRPRAGHDRRRLRRRRRDAGHARQRA